MVGKQTNKAFISKGTSQKYDFLMLLSLYLVRLLLSCFLLSLCLSAAYRGKGPHKRDANHGDKQDRFMDIVR